LSSEAQKAEAGISSTSKSSTALPPNQLARLESGIAISLESRYPSPPTDLDEIASVIP
jgi:hypothetical protein